VAGLGGGAAACQGHAAQLRLPRWLGPPSSLCETLPCLCLVFWLLPSFSGRVRPHCTFLHAPCCCPSLDRRPDGSCHKPSCRGAHGRATVPDLVTVPSSCRPSRSGHGGVCVGWGVRRGGVGWWWWGGGWGGGGARGTPLDQDEAHGTTWPRGAGLRPPRLDLHLCPAGPAAYAAALACCLCCSLGQEAATAACARSICKSSAAAGSGQALLLHVARHCSPPLGAVAIASLAPRRCPDLQWPQQQAQRKVH
jgi:hypothetical protein